MEDRRFADEFSFYIENCEGFCDGLLLCRSIGLIGIGRAIGVDADCKTRNTSHNSRFGQWPVATLANWQVTNQFCGKM
jgi:hypothetical protein